MLDIGFAPGVENIRKVRPHGMHLFTPWWGETYPLHRWWREKRT